MNLTDTRRLRPSKRLIAPAALLHAHKFDARLVEVLDWVPSRTREGNTP